MVEAGMRDQGEVGFGEFLGARARNATDSRLAVDISVGVVAVIVAAALRPEWWLLLAAAGVCLASFGFWATIDRIGGEGRSPQLTSALAAARAFFSVSGIIAALATAFLIWTLLMGTWIS